MQYSKLNIMCQVYKYILFFPPFLSVFPICRAAESDILPVFFGKFFDIQIRSAYSYTL